MELSIIGLNHRGAPVDVREKLAFAEAKLPAAIDALRRATGASEAVILSTCNRVEIYSMRTEAADDEILAAARWLSDFHGIPQSVVRPILYRHAGLDAVRHLYRVAAGLDAMVVGETQIIAQVKQAYLTAKEAGHTGKIFNHLFQRALHVAKQIHATTAVGVGSVSVPSVSAKLAEKVFQNLAKKRVMVLGAGETAELTLGAFRERGAVDLVVANRTLEHGEALAAKYSGRAVPLDRMADAMAQADIVISCLSGMEFHVQAAAVEAALKARRGEPMVLIDLGVPRNIHPATHQLENIYLFNIDDLERIVHQNVVEREREMAKCLPLIEVEAQQSLLDLGEPETNQLVSRLREALHAMGEEELNKALGSLPEEHREEVQFLVRRVINKILHAPTTALKETGRSAPLSPEALELVRRLFNLK